MVRRSLTAFVAFALVLMSAPLGAKPAAAAGTIGLAALGIAYTEDFNTLANTGTSTATPNGWGISEIGTAANDSYAAGTGSSQTGNTYSFGTAASSERALGALLSNALNPIFGASFTNNTVAELTRLDVSYTGEQWRIGALARTDRIDFQWSTDATSLTTGTWSDVDALDFTGPVTTGTIGQLDGNLAANRTALAGSIVANIPSGSIFWIRWTDFNPAGSDDGLSVDDFSLTPRQSDQAPIITATSPVSGASSVALDANITLTFSEPVSTTRDWFTIVCATSGSHTANGSGGPTTFTLDPVANFASNESCTVTVVRAGVTDQDADDPPNNMAADFALTFQTADVLVCGDIATKVHQVQGSGAATPMSNAIVVVEGVVVGDYQQAGGFNGFYVQEEAGDADADPLTSEGIFVFNTSFAVNSGDVVRVRGRAGEFSGQTQLSSVSALLVCSSGATAPAAPVSLPVADIADLERFEGMLVNFAQTLTATEVFTLARFGEVSLSGAGRLYTPTAVTTPGAAAIAQEQLNDRSRIILDDGNNQQNIDPTLYPQGGLSASNTLRVGDTLAGLTGVMDFRFSSYRVQPVGPISFAHANARTAAPDGVGGNLKIASFNVLNFFNGDGLGGGFPTARGATTPFELQRQLVKEVSALMAMNADIVGLMEIENDAQPNSALEDLVEALNAVMGAGTYAFIDTGVIGTDAIKVALIYKPAAVTPIGLFKTITSAVDPRFVDTLNRPSLAQTFEHNMSGQTLTVVVNHLKSKGSSCNHVGDPDLGDGQGNCNKTRTAAAAALASWLATDPTSSGDPDFLILGDLNSYTFEDPITTLTSSGYTNLIRTFGGLTPYSYVFQGESGYLDHALATSSLASQVTGVTDWHINPDEPIALDYNVEFKTASQVNTFYDSGPYRSSDHDPVIVGLQFDVLASTRANVEGAPLWAGDIRTKVNVNGMSGEAKGRVTFEGAGRSYDSTRIESIVASGSDATVFGSFGSVLFRLDVHDGGRDGADSLRLRTSDGYDSGVLTESRGQLVVHAD